LFQQDDIIPAQFCQVICKAASNGTATNDYYLGMFWKTPRGVIQVLFFAHFSPPIPGKKIIYDWVTVDATNQNKYIMLFIMIRH
jgi:hypothetical protein